MALGEVTSRDWLEVIRREFSIGLALGVVLAAIGALRILLWQGLFGSYGQHYVAIAITVSLSLVGVVLWGTLTGSMLPFVLRVFKLDPASASAPFVATLVDVTGLIIYFTIAAVVLRGTLLRRSKAQVAASQPVVTCATLVWAGSLQRSLDERGMSMQTTLLRDGPEKTFAVVFDVGEEVVAALLRFARDQKLTAAHLTAIGAFQRVTLGFFEPTTREYTPIAIEEQVELLSLVGNIARDDKGDPQLHAHVVVGKSDGTAHGGHLLEASVRPTMEIVVVESSQYLRRRMRDDVGAAMLDLSS